MSALGTDVEGPEHRTCQTQEQRFPWGASATSSGSRELPSEAASAMGMGLAAAAMGFLPASLALASEQSLCSGLGCHPDSLVCPGLQVHSRFGEGGTTTLQVPPSLVTLSDLRSRFCWGAGTCMCRTLGDLAGRFMTGDGRVRGSERPRGAGRQ